MVPAKLLLYLAEEANNNQVPWVQIVIVLIVGVSGAGFASVLRAIFGKKLSDAKADAQILHNAQEIINELRRQKVAMEEDFREKIKELTQEVNSLKRSLREERRLAQEESARLRSELNEKDREIDRLRRGQ